MRRRSLPQIVIPVPCHVDWNSMTRIDSEGRARFCMRCERPVYDSAAITRDELLDLIAKHEGRRLPCIQLHRRPDGTIVTRDCFAPLLRVGRFLWVQVALAAVAFWTCVFGIRPLVRFLRRDAAALISSEEMTPPRKRTHSIRRGMITILPPPPPPERTSLLARTPGSSGWSLLPTADRAAPLRTLVAEEETWKPANDNPDDE
jgi:hypothetical protein